AAVTSRQGTSHFVLLLRLQEWAQARRSGHVIGFGWCEVRRRFRCHDEDTQVQLIVRLTRLTLTNSQQGLGVQHLVGLPENRWNSIGEPADTKGSRNLSIIKTVGFVARTPVVVLT